MHLRVVLDTNIYYSAIVIPHSHTRKILTAAFDGKFTTLISPSIIDELGEKLRDKAELDDECIAQNLKRIVRMAELVLIIDEHVFDTVRDIDDHHIVACAVSGNADLIVSGDKDLYTHKKIASIGVARPVDLARTLNL